VKQKKYGAAIEEYLKVSQKYPDSQSQSGLPLALISRLQIVYCYQSMGSTENILDDALVLYKDVLCKRWPLNEAQFRTYSTLTEEIIGEELLKMKDEKARAEYEREFTDLKRHYQKQSEQWKIVSDLKMEVIPELLRSQDQSGKQQSTPLRFSKTFGERTHLVTGIRYQDRLDADSYGILGAKIKNDVFLDNVLREIISSLQFTKETKIVISNLSGVALVGRKDPSSDTVTVTEFFDDNFPPWRIEFYRAQAQSLGILDLKRNFYFWTIITLIIVLTFGTVLIVRTIVHEMDVLKIKSDFVSSVSHEFKTPLTSIKALTERLQSGKIVDQAKMKQYFSVISQDVDKLTGLVKNILDFSKIEEGKKEFDFQETDICLLVNEQIQDFKKSEMSKEIEVDTQFHTGVPDLFVDREALAQAFNNLLENAVKFSSGKKKIEVTVKKDENNVIIEVSDRGIGIPQDEQDKIFDKFYQGRNALRQSVKGTGLGLTLVKHTVEAHEGRITVHSKIGEGSTFSLILPIKKKGMRGKHG
jgi:signal transduction histidine kinase